MDPPIKQGQTRYPHLVLHFPKDDISESTVNLPKDLADKQKELADEDGKMKGKTYELVSKAFKVLAGKKITIPNSFKSYNGTSAVKCSLKANDGFLYPLERSIFFVHKPPTHIRFDDVTLVELARVSASESSSNRTFDIIVTTKNNNVFQFTGIQRQEYTSLHAFFNNKSLNVRTTMGEGEEAQAALLQQIAAGNDEESEEDEDFVGLEEDEVPEEFESDEESDVDDEEGVPEDEEEDAVNEVTSTGATEPKKGNFTL